MSHITSISIKNLTSETLNKAALIRAEIDKLEKQLARLLEGQLNLSDRVPSKRGRPSKFVLPNGSLLETPKRKKRQLSPEARARIVAAVKARWAREKANTKKQ